METIEISYFYNIKLYNKEWEFDPILRRSKFYLNFLKNILQIKVFLLPKVLFLMSLLSKALMSSEMHPLNTNITSGDCN